MILFTHHHHQPKVLPIESTGGEITVTPVTLRRNDPSSPWCYAANLTPIVIDGDDLSGGGSSSSSSAAASSSSSNASIHPTGSNFLATQVWPSSRTASAVLERNMDASWTVCELGCGPGLPSLAAARSGARRVIATDVDDVALCMVRAAAIEQGFIVVVDDDDDIDRVGDENAPRIRADDEGNRRGRRGRRPDDAFVTMKFDLTSRDTPLPTADLYVLSDVFESSSVAEGAAWHVRNVLSNNRGRTWGDDRPMSSSSPSSSSGIFSRVWVFAQSDRAQRDTFLGRMREWYENDDEDRDRRRHVGWTMDHNPNRDDELWLFDLDETTVDYN
jgi:hypothetical protein